MAFKKIVAQRLFDSYKITRPSLTTCRICSSTMTKSMASPNPERIAPDPGEGAFFRRSLHRSSLFQSLATSSELRSFPIGEKLRQELRGMDIGRDRIRLDGLISPPQQKSLPEMESELAEEGKFTVADAKKVMRLAQLEVVKSRLRQMENDWISYPEFFQICNGASSNFDQALEFAKMLDQSGIVIVLGNVVFLKPDKVVKAMEGLMPMPLAQPFPQMMKEFQQMDEKKSAIDKKAESLVQRELWCGLGFFVIQTAAFMRLTFWELTWDVMEPICFYVTSFYCMAGYAFFLRTSKEPTYEGFFHSRFSAKQKKLMKLHNFDLQRYNELRKACDPHSSIPTGNTLTLHSTPMMSTA